MGVAIYFNAGLCKLCISNNKKYNGIRLLTKNLLETGCKFPFYFCFTLYLFQGEVKLYLVASTDQEPVVMKPEIIID